MWTHFEGVKTKLLLMTFYDFLLQYFKKRKSHVFGNLKILKMCTLKHCPGIGEQSNAINVSVCLSVCLSAHVSQKHMFEFHKISILAVCGGGSILLSWKRNKLCCVLPVLWMTSRFHIMVHIQWIDGSGQRRTTCHPLPERCRLAHSWQQTILLGGAAGGVITGRGAKSVVSNCLVFDAVLRLTDLGHGKLKHVQVGRLIGQHHVEDEASCKVADDERPDGQRCKDGFPRYSILLHTFKNKRQIVFIIISFY